jgi:hypothetical protein
LIVLTVFLENHFSFWTHLQPVLGNLGNQEGNAYPPLLAPGRYSLLIAEVFPGGYPGGEE